MPAIERTCKVTGKKFLVSELEQELREKFGVELPDTHPYERIRRLMSFRNLINLYQDKCDFCGKTTLSYWGENPEFPVSCHECYEAEKTTPVELELDLERPFFDQYKELLSKTPRTTRQILSPIENSEYTSHATGLKNCYMCFNVTNLEDCYYSVASVNLKDSVDTLMTNDAESLYECLGCHNSYQVFWSQFALNCTDSYFLYDCSGCNDCALSSGLRNKSYVFMNEQLTKEAYEKKVADLKTGSYAKLKTYLAEFAKMRDAYPKKYIIGDRNENVSGNIIFKSKNIENGFQLTEVEDGSNIFNLFNSKDVLDVASYGGGLEKAYSCCVCGGDSSDLKFSMNCFGKTSNLTYCMNVQASTSCFGCAFVKKKNFAILNKQYSESEYKDLVGKLIEKMKERGEWGKVFRDDLLPFAYNESFAQIAAPLTKEEAEKRGFRWKEINTPKVSPEQVLQFKDTIGDYTLDEIKTKVAVCEETGRPYKITHQEFAFYQKHNIPLPRLHPFVRLEKRYPKDLLYNLHTSHCSKCNTEFETSMPETEKLLCEKCYLEAVR